MQKRRIIVALFLVSVSIVIIQFSMSLIMPKAIHMGEPSVKIVGKNFPKDFVPDDYGTYTSGPSIEGHPVHPELVPSSLPTKDDRNLSL